MHATALRAGGWEFPVRSVPVHAKMCIFGRRYVPVHANRSVGTCRYVPNSGIATVHASTCHEKPKQLLTCAKHTVPPSCRRDRPASTVPTVRAGACHASASHRACRAGACRDLQARVHAVSVHAVAEARPSVPFRAMLRYRVPAFRHGMQTSMINISRSIIFHRLF